MFRKYTTFVYLHVSHVYRVTFVQFVCIEEPYQPARQRGNYKGRSCETYSPFPLCTCNMFMYIRIDIVARTSLAGHRALELPVYAGSTQLLS